MIDAVSIPRLTSATRATRWRVSWAGCLALVLLAACHSGAGGRANGIETFGAAGGAEAAGSTGADAARLQTAVIGARTSAHLHASTAQDKDAAPGDQFVVLDVSVHNRDSQPHVFSEGKLIDVSESGERTFATPVDMLADEFLTLRVVSPSSSVHGKLAYEVPRDLHGVLYWQPGDGSQRILLHLDSPAKVADNDPASGVDRRTPVAPVTRSLPPGMRPATATTRVIAKATRAGSRIDPVDSSAGDASTVAPTARGSVVMNNPPATAVISTPPMHPHDATCEALVSRNDPAERPRNLDFFERECSGYALPSAWRASQVATNAPTDMPPASIPPATPAPATAGATWPPRPGPAFDCSQAWTKAEHLVCDDAVLSLMDWELNRAFARARRSVADPDGLQRDEDQWRHRVRDACQTRRCVESVYGERTASLEAIAQSR